MPDDDRTQPTSAAGEQPRLLAGRYDVIEVIGSGASAITWRGHDRRLDRQVAIKILRREGEQDAAYVQRFEREARTSASVSNGHVVNIYDVGQQDGWLYLVMQFVDGEDLKHLIARRGPLPLAEAREITRQILDGLAAIHRAGILHRDIKPQNVLVDRAGVVRVADFGIAQTATDAGLTVAGTAVGTAAYMAPEQAQAGSLSEATDIYAVGVVLYEMLTGALPFDRSTAMATMLAHVQQQPMAPSQRAPRQNIPSRFDGIVLQAMSKNPQDRFRSATAMARALDGKPGDPGATTRTAATLLTSRDQTPGAPATARDQAWPAVAGRPEGGTPQSGTSARPARSAGRGLLNAVLVLILAAMTVVAAYTYYEYTNNRVNGGDPPPTSPVEQIILTQPPAPTELPVIDPLDDVSQPTDVPEPTFASQPTPEPDPTSEPTEVLIEPADDPGPIIGPDGSPGDG
ncbi:MAG: protein kinase [Chloroflexia bacterium]|nr:protein kinase [Chloroflexia bacterium]